MRLFVRLLCAAALGVSSLAALPAAALETTWLHVASGDQLLIENGDGYWESATVEVSSDADTARWALVSAGGQVVAEADFTDEQLRAARYWGAALPVSSARTGVALAAGDYTFSVTASATGKASATSSATIHVRTGSPLTALAPSSPVIYPRDHVAGVAHTVAFRHGLDADVVEWTSAMWEVVGTDGIVAGPWNIDPADPLLRWDGRATPGAGGSEDAPPGTYHVRLRVRDNGWQVTGPESEPVRVSWRYRVPRDVTISRPANATRTATLTQRRARVRVVDGSLRYRAFNTDWRRRPLVRTAHRVRIPRDRAPGFPVFLVVRGRIALAIDLDLEVVTPAGKVRNIDIFGAKDQRSLSYSIPRRMIRADGTVRFRLLWTSWGPPSRTGRTDRVGLQYTTYAWRGPA